MISNRPPSPDSVLTSPQLRDNSRTDAKPTTRERLLAVATEVFAEKGFSAATTREICDRAHSNLAAIHYHFGDKRELYRQVILAPLQMFANLVEGFDQAQGDFTAKMKLLYRGILTPLFSPEPEFSHHLKIHFRELAEPTFEPKEIMDLAMIPFCDRLRALLREELGPKASDDDLVRLSVTLLGMGFGLFDSMQCIRMIAPSAVNQADSHSIWVDRLSGYAKSMLEYERQRLESL